MFYPKYKSKSSHNFYCANFNPSQYREKLQLDPLKWEYSLHLNSQTIQNKVPLHSHDIP